MTYREFLNQIFLTIGIYETFYIVFIILTYIFVKIKVNIRLRKSLKAEGKTSD